jgi:FkbM family methyltransferase
MYSQGDEDVALLTYFKGFTGRLLEIGAYHPKVFSNSRALIEAGWEAVLVEPSPKCFPSLEEEYKLNPKVQLLDAAIGPKDGVLKFYDSAGGVATAVENHYLSWKDRQLDYTEIYVECLSWKSFYKRFPGVYDFISIDTEGMDGNILSQIDLDETQTKAICIEPTYNQSDIIKFLLQWGFNTKIFQSINNMILVRKYGDI